MVGWPPLCLAILLVLGSAFGRPCLAAEKTFEVIPKIYELNSKWVRPGPDTVVTVKLDNDVVINKKVVLRLTATDKPIKDLPIDSEQLRKGVAEVKIPGPMRRGQYKTELVSDDGKVLARGKNDLNVSASEKPIIVAVRPRVAYPRDGRFDLEIIGDNFTDFDEKKINIRINENPIAIVNRMTDKRRKEYEEYTQSSTDDVKGKLPSLILNWRSIRIFGLSLDNQSFRRPLVISVESDGLISDEKPIVLSTVGPSTPRLIAVVVLSVFVACVFLFSQQAVKRHHRKNRKYNTLSFLFIEPQSNTYSLSKLQLILWTAAAILAYSYIAVSHFLVQSQWVLPKVPQGLPVLLGLSATTTALAVGATGFRGSKGAGPVHPGIGDFISTGGVFAPERLQFFLWTILGTIAFVAATLVQDPGTVTNMAEIPENFNPLMGASSLGYLAGKFARKGGPVIKHIDPPPPYPSPALELSKGIRIIGENLSPRAQVRLNGVLLPTDQVGPADEKLVDTEFVSELKVTPLEVKPPVAGVAPVKIMNPDGQSAEMGETTAKVAPAGSRE